jgi:hypothetical protein
MKKKEKTPINKSEIKKKMFQMIPQKYNEMRRKHCEHLYTNILDILEEMN